MAVQKQFSNFQKLISSTNLPVLSVYPALLMGILGLVDKQK